MRCLVTGAAGFIASTLAHRLLADGHEVVGVDGFVDNYAEPLKRANLASLLGETRFSFVEGLIEALDVEPLVAQVDHVYHLAALPGVRSSWGESFEGYASHNVYATQRLLEASRRVGVERFAYASSSSVYGDTDVLPMVETGRERPHSPYGVTKLAGEHLVRLYHRNYGVPTVSLRYFTVYGPRQRPDMAIQRFLTAARNGTPITLFGDGEQTRDFTYVDDTINATLRAAERGRLGAVYNVGGGSTVTVNRLIEVIEGVTGSRLEVRREGVQHGDVGHTLADTRRANEDLDFVPLIQLQDGIARHWNWLRATDRQREIGTQ